MRMNLVSIITLLVILSFVCEGFQWPAYRLSSTVSPRQKTTLFAKPIVGEVVSATLNKISGSANNPIAVFSIDLNGEMYSGLMITTAMTREEKAKLQIGAVLDVVVTSNTGIKLELKLAKSTDRPKPSVNGPNISTEKDNKNETEEGKEAEEGEEDGYDDGELSEEQQMEYLKKEFDNLRKNKLTIEVAAFLKLEAIKQLIAQDLIDRPSLYGIIEEMGLKETSEMDFDTYVKLNRNITEFIRKEIENGPKEIFDSLSKDNGQSVTVKDFIGWNDIHELLTSNMVSKGNLEAMFTAIGVDKNGSMTFKQFMQMMSRIAEVLEGLPIHKDLDNSPVTAVRSNPAPNVDKVVVNY